MFGPMQSIYNQIGSVAQQKQTKNAHAELFNFQVNDNNSL